jgi:hypothetical protein
VEHVVEEEPLETDNGRKEARPLESVSEEL